MRDGRATMSVLARDPASARNRDLLPIKPAAMADRQVIEWDKDDIDILKFMKVDCLALGMLSCMKRAYSSGSFESTISTMRRNSSRCDCRLAPH